MVDAVRALSSSDDSAEAIERLRLLEEMKSAISAAQARQAVRFDVVQRAAQAVAGVPNQRQGRGVAAQIALALRVSPHRAQRWLGWATFVTAELPETFAELQAGRTTEWRTMLVAREAAILSREQRAVIDAELAPQLESSGDRRIEAAARKVAYRLDPSAVVARARQAANDRHVSIRPAPDTMCRLSLLAPLAQGVAAYAALTREADMTTAVGDERGRGQIMADVLIERVTGQTVAGDVPAEVVVVMADATMLGHDDEPGELLGHGPIPAVIARELAFGIPQGTAGRWLRRLYAAPATGRLIAMESRRREFSTGMQHFLRLRDKWCRTPWCDAPIRHADHIEPHDEGGLTDIDNGQGLCEALQLRQTGTRLDRANRPRRHDRHPNPHPPPLSQPRARATESSTAHRAPDRRRLAPPSRRLTCRHRLLHPDEHALTREPERRRGGHGSVVGRSVVVAVRLHERLRVARDRGSRPHRLPSHTLSASRDMRAWLDGRCRSRRGRRHRRGLAAGASRSGRRTAAGAVPARPAGRRLAERRARIFTAHALRKHEFDVLAALRRAGEPFEQTAGELAVSTYVTSGTMTSRLDGLTERHLVTRAADRADGRLVRVALTETGREVVDTAFRALLEAERELLTPLPAELRAPLAAALRTLLLAAASDPSDRIAT